MNLKSLLHYDIVLEKYNKLVKTRKLTSLGILVQVALRGGIPTNCVLKKMPTPHGNILGYFFFLLNHVLSFSKETMKKNLCTCQKIGLGKLDQA